MTYPTLNNLKTFLGVSGSGQDATLQWIIDGVISWVEGETGRVFVAVDETRAFPVEYPYVDMTRRRFTPLQDFVAVNSFTNPEGFAIPATDYFLLPAVPPHVQLVIYPDSQYRLTAYPLTNILADFDWGYSAACPDDMFQAILHIGQYAWLLREAGGVAGAAQEQRGGKVVVNPQDLPEMVARTLARYKRQ